MFESTGHAESGGMGGNGHSSASAHLRETWQQTQTQLRGLDRQARNFARERPFAALAAALVAGYVVGRLVARL